MEPLPRGRALLRRRAQPLRVHRLDRLPALIKARTLLSTLLGNVLGTVLGTVLIAVLGTVLIAMLLSLVPGCDDSKLGGKSRRSRVEAVRAQKPLQSAESWCDVYHEASKATRLELPSLRAARPGSEVRPLPAERWIWLNLWATWCKPCLREMPLIERWMGALGRAGVKVELWYLSVDEELDALRAFFKQRPSIAPKNSLWLSNGEALQPWLRGLGLSPDTTIPINMLVAPGGGLRCIRTGSINDSHYAILRRFLRTGK